MADQIYLSLWLRDDSGPNLLAGWARALAAFPVSSLAPGIRELTVYPFQWGETPVLEQSFPEGAEVAHVAALASEILHEDYACEAELNWDVWVPRAAGSLDQWERVPQPVSVACLGPEFESEDREDCSHLLINFGLDSIFLPEHEDQAMLKEALEGIAGSSYRENVAQLVGYLRKIEKTLPVARRHLWSASGEDLAARIRSAWAVE